nr:hypothetical protein [uncultured Allomuricauda sp.]
MMESKSIFKKLFLQPNCTYQLSLFRLATKQEISQLAGNNKNIKAMFEITSQPNGHFEDLHGLAIIELNTADDAMDFSGSMNVRSVESTFLRVESEASLELSQDKYYEFFAAWLKPGKEHLLKEFFVASEPIKQNYGRPVPQIKVEFETTHGEQSDIKTFSPHLSGIVEWNDESDVYQLLQHPDFYDKAAPLFEKAILRMEMILGKII